MWKRYIEEYGEVFSFKQTEDSRIHFRRPKTAYCGWHPERHRFFCGKHKKDNPIFRGTWRYNTYNKK